MTATNKTILLNDKRTINGWAMFDWANSAYALVISTAVFPGYFEAVVPQKVSFLGLSIPNSALLAYAVTLSYLFIALISPLLSGIADFGGKRKTFMRFFTTLGAIACLFMFFFDGETRWQIGFWTYIVATIGFAGGLVFNNAYLPLIATPDRYDAVSARGYSFGYIGSTLLLIVILVMIQFYDSFGFSDAAAPVRWSFVLVGLWWMGFARLSYSRMPADNSPPLSIKVIAQGYTEIRAIWALVKTQTALKTFLFAFFFYNAGVQTIIFLATIFAKKDLDFQQADLILLVLVLQFVGAFGAWLFSKVSQKKGNKNTLVLILLVWIGICFTAFFVKDKSSFYVLGSFVGLVMGGIQSLSRSTYSKLLPENTTDTTSYFSFYDITDKISVVMGTLVFGSIDQFIGIRFSVLSMGLLFLLGLLALSRVRLR